MRNMTKAALAAALEKQTASTTIAEAQRDQALDALAALVAQQNPKEHQTPDQQAVVRWARAVLAEMQAVCRCNPVASGR